MTGIRDRIAIVPFWGPHLYDLEVPPVQAAELAVARADPDALERRWARSIFLPAGRRHLSGRVVACAGVQPLWPGRAFAWALIDRRFPRPAWLPFTRATRAMLEAAGDDGFARLETTVADGFAPGLRWVRLLGFEVEGLMRAWLAGRDYLLYAKIRDQGSGIRDQTPDLIPDPCLLTSEPAERAS